MSAKIDLSSIQAYAESCRALADQHFPAMTLEEAAAAAEDFNAYPGLENLGRPRGLITLEDRLTQSMIDRARRTVLAGGVVWEHAAAGEATRLRLGPKYLIIPDGLRFGPGGPVRPEKLLSLNLGTRHLLQWAFEIKALAEEYGQDPAEALARQKVLLVVGAQSGAGILESIVKSNFLGLKAENFLFMEQPSFRGLSPTPRGWRYNPGTASRLHNHGQLAMQKTMDRQVFHFDPLAGRRYLSQAEFFSLLDSADDLVSYNIEDLGYLDQALDFETIGLALELGREGFGMTMEIVANNPDHPVKGGLCAFDPALGRDVMVESFRLRDLAPERIIHLNKNFNHYPAPGRVFRKLHLTGLFMPVAVKDGGLYFQPVQGDLNFLTPTAFISRRRSSPLKSWKTPDDTPAALEAMARQDGQLGFADFAAGVLDRAK